MPAASATSASVIVRRFALNARNTFSPFSSDWLNSRSFD